MIRPLALAGIYQWSRWQPDRGMDFNSFLLVRPDGNVAVDPLPLDEPGLAQLDALGGVSWIVLTNRDHQRATGVLRERYGARVLAGRTEAGLFTEPIDATFDDGEELLPGLVAIALEGAKTPGEVALELRASGAAIVGDAILGVPSGALSLLPDEKLADPQRLLLSLRRVWALRLNALLLCDGQPLYAGADEAIGALLESRGGPAVNRINLDELRYESRARGSSGRYRAQDAEIGNLIGARQLGYRVAVLPPGAWYCPMHSHQTEEELFYVIDGEPTIRTPRGSLRCRPGDFVAFARGERGAHQLRNESERPCTLFLLGVEDAAAVVFYPESQKLGLRSPRLIVRSSPALEYFDGEES